MKNKGILREVIVDSWSKLNNNMETDVTNEERDELLGYILSDPRITDILGEGVEVLQYRNTGWGQCSKCKATVGKTHNYCNKCGSSVSFVLNNQPPTDKEV